VYKANDVAQSTAGITLTTDFDGVTGLNNVLIDLSADAFYAIGNDYQAIITTGTVNSVSVVGEVVAEFSIQNRYQPPLSVGSAAISTQAESETLTTGTAVNDYTDTVTLNGIYHEISDAAGVFELYYQFDVGGNGVAVTVEMTGRLQGSNDDIGVFAYNWAGASWDQIGAIQGANSTTDGTSTFNLLARHTGTGANIGKVRVRGYKASGLTSATLYIDQAFVSYSVVTNSVGYANGAVWIDTVNGTAGTESFVNGVADNPSDSLADAATIAVALSLHKYEISTDSTLTLVSTLADGVFIGKGYALALGGQICTGSHFIGGCVSGSATTTGNEIHFSECEMEACTLGASHLHNCGLTSTITLSEATTYTLQSCHSEIAGSAAPTIDFGAAIGNTSLNMRRYSGGIEIQNMGTTGADTMSLEGTGALTINANSTGGDIALRGDFTITGAAAFIAAGGTITYDNNTANIAAILADTSSFGIVKNAAFSNFEFPMVLTSDHYTAAISKTVTGQMSIDGASFVAINGAISEVGSGVYQADLLASDTNGEVITYKFSAANADDTIITVTTRA
jgi:hypothetical protein